MRVIVAGVMLFLFPASDHGEAVQIVADGKAQAEIVIATNAPRMVEYAAEELQTYVEKIGGVRLPIERVSPEDKVVINETESYIFIGESPYTRRLRIGLSGLEPDGFKIVAEDNWLAILGRDYRGPPIGTLKRGTDWSYDPKTGISIYGETGTLFGVYHFLEKLCGIRWFMPGELGEVVPKMPTIKISKTSISKAPFIDYRHLMAYYIFKSDKEHVHWYRRAGFGGSYAASIGHSFQLFDKWAKDHPNYFYLDADGKPEKRLYLCLTEPEVIQDVTAYIRKYFDEHAEKRIFPLMPKDYHVIPNVRDEELTDARFKGLRKPEMGKYGQCSEYVWGFINKVAKEVYKTHPDRLIGCCAYNPYRTPPAAIKTFSPNVAAMICMMTANHANKKEEAEFYELVTEWYGKCKNIYFWDYASHYYLGLALSGTPVTYSHLIAKEFKKLKSMLGKDWKGIFLEAESGRPQVRKFRNREMSHLTYYVFSRCLWDPDLDIDELLYDYYEKLFGPARDEMRKYYDLSEKLYSEKLDKYDFKGKHYYHIAFFLRFTPEESDKLIGYLQEAKKKAGDTIYGKRVDMILAQAQSMKEKHAIVSQYPCVPFGRIEGKVKEEGLAGYWRFDEGEGRITRDSSGNGNDGVIHNAKWLNAPHGSALEFNGKDSAVEIRYPKNLDPKRNITLMGWFFFEKSKQPKAGLIWTDNYAYLLHIDRGIQFNFYNERGGVNRTFGFTTRYLNIPGWNHIAGSYNGRYLRIYLNGEKKAEERAGGNIRYSGDGKPWEYFKEFKVHIGASNYGTQWQKSFNGRIDEVKIYTRVLSDEEIKREFEKGKEAFLGH